MNIYLDESGDLGFDFSKTKTSRYLVIGLLVFFDETSHSCMKQAMKKTLRNKLPKFTTELKELTEEAAFSKGELKTHEKYWDYVSTEKTLMSDSYQKGLDKGFEKGQEEGRQQGKIEFAKKQLKRGLAIEIIAEDTELTLEEVRALQR